MIDCPVCYIPANADKISRNAAGSLYLSFRALFIIVQELYRDRRTDDEMKNK